MSENQPRDLEAPIIERLEARFSEIAADMLERAQRVAGYATYADPAFVAAARAHCEDHLRAFLTVARERRLLQREELAFVEEQAELRARQGVPLDALLHVYRRGHEAIFDAIVENGGSTAHGLEGSLALTGRTLPHIDSIATLFTECYLETEHELRSGVEQARRDLVDQILRGTLDPDAAASKRATSIGIDLDAPFLVAVCAPTGGSPTVDIRSLARKLTGRDRSPTAVLVVIARDREVVALIRASCERGALRTRIEQAVAEGGQIAGGVSLPCAGLGELPRGYAEAQRMVNRTPAGRVSILDEFSTADYIAATADTSAARLINPTVRTALEADAEAGGVLLDTLVAYLDASQNAGNTARSLHVHTNTVHYRLSKLSRESELDTHRFHDLVELLTAARVLGLRPVGLKELPGRVGSGT